MTQHDIQSLPERLRDWGHPDWYYATTDLLADNEEIRRGAADHIEEQDAEIAALKSRVEEAEKVIREVARSYPVAAGTSKYGYEEDHDGYGSIRECRLYLERHGLAMPLEDRK